MPSEKHSPTSAKLLEKADGLNESAECFGKSQACKLRIDSSKQLVLNDGLDYPPSVTGRPGQSSRLGNLDSQTKSEERVFQDRKEELFDPFAEGVEFTLPGKYHKLKSTSTRLYSELRKLVHEKDDKVSPCHYFVERLEAEFDVGNISTHNEIHDKAKGLLAEHEKLSLLRNAVVSRSHNLRDDSSWQDVCKCYRHWQIVLSKFNELQRRTQQLLQGKREILNSPSICYGILSGDVSLDNVVVNEVDDFLYSLHLPVKCTDTVRRKKIFIKVVYAFVLHDF